MKPIPYETALALAKLIDAAARQLNDRISEAHNLGMTVDVELTEVRHMSDPPLWIFQAATKVRPDQISLTPGHAPETEGRNPE